MRGRAGTKNAIKNRKLLYWAGSCEELDHTFPGATEPAKEEYIYIYSRLSYNDIILILCKDY